MVEMLVGLLMLSAQMVLRRHFYFTGPIASLSSDSQDATAQVGTVLCSSAALVIKIIDLIYPFSITVSGPCLQRGPSSIVNVPCSMDVLIGGYSLTRSCRVFMHPVFFFHCLNVCICWSSTSQNWFKFHFSQCLVGLEALVVPTFT